MAETLSFEYRTQLDFAKEEAGEIMLSIFIRNMKLVEAQRKFFRNVRRMEGKLKRRGIT